MANQKGAGKRRKPGKGAPTGEADPAERAAAPVASPEPAVERDPTKSEEDAAAWRPDPGSTAVSTPPAADPPGPPPQAQADAAPQAQADAAPETAEPTHASEAPTNGQAMGAATAPIPTRLPRARRSLWAQQAAKRPRSASAGRPAKLSHAGEPAALKIAPVLARRMTLGPWLLLWRLSSAEPRFMQWRARRLDADGTQASEVALLVPHEWRAWADLAPALAAAAVPAFELTHPTIARLLEVGVTDEGTPWLATELVEGHPIDQWVRAHGSDVQTRRALLEQAAQGAAYAHARKVCHGRVRPSQIVISAGDQVRWLNFGLAEVLAVLGAQAEGSTTSAGATPARAYMAPELASHDDVATEAGDIYALGLVALEVLAGASPRLSADTGGPATQWPRPSDLAPTVAWRRELREGFDAIVTRATMPLPAERYASMAEFADDLRRAAARLPLVAVDGGLPYRFGRLARRHPWLMGAAAGVALAFTGAFAALGWQAFSTARELERAEAARRGTEAAMRVLQATWQAEATPAAGAASAGAGSAEGGGRDAVARLAAAERMARSSLAEHPASLAAALAMLGRMQADRGAFAEGHKLLTEALPQLATPDQQAEAGCDEAWAQARLGERADRAEARIRSGIGTPRARSLTRALCLTRLADIELLADRLPDARQTLREARRQWERSAEKPAELAVQLASAAAPLSSALGKFREAQEWAQWALPHIAALQLDRRAPGVELRGLLVELRLAAGDAQQALQLADDNLALVAGSAFPAAAEPATAPPAAAFIAAAEPRLELHRLDEARARLERAVATADARGDVAQQRRARCLLAQAALREQDTAGAARWLKTAPPPTPLEAAAPAGTATAEALGNEPLRDPAREAARAALREAAFACQLAQAELALQLGRPIEAQREADRLLSETRETPSRTAANAMRLRAQSLLNAGQNDRALSAALLALQQARALQDEDDAPARPSLRSGQAAVVLAEAYRATGDFDNARKSIDLAQQQLSATLPEPHPWRQRAAASLATLVAATPK